MSMPVLTALTNAGRAIVPPKTAAPIPTAKLFQLHLLMTHSSIVSPLLCSIFCYGSIVHPTLNTVTGLLRNFQYGDSLIFSNLESTSPQSRVSRLLTDMSS